MVLVSLGLVLALGPLTKRLCQRLGLPTSVGYVLLGLLLGTALRALDATQFDAVTGTFGVFAQLGVVALLFRVGLRSHTSALLQKLPDASVIWIANVLGAALVGFVVARYALHWSFETSLVIGTAFSATSIAVSLSVWDELGLGDSDTGVMLLDIAELDDLSAAVMLAVLLGLLPSLVSGDGELMAQAGAALSLVLLKLALFVGGCYVFAHFIEAHFTAFNRRMSETRASLTISILGAGLVIAAAADYLGFSVAIGALFAGLAFSRDPEAVRTDGSFTYFYEFLTPFFFIHIGMQVDMSALVEVLPLGLVLIAAAILAKFVFTAAPALLSMSKRDAAALGASMIPRAEIALVVVYECRAIEPSSVSAEVFAAMVLVAVTTCIASPVWVRRILRQAPA